MRISDWSSDVCSSDLRDSCQNVTAGIQQIFQSTGLGTIIVDADIVDYERERGTPVSGAKGTEKAIFPIEHRQGISLPQPTVTLPRRPRTPTCDFFSMTDETPLGRTHMSIPHCPYIGYLQNSARYYNHNIPFRHA